jgi:hypothetical protein
MVRGAPTVTPPLVLDLDGAVQGLAGGHTIRLRNWEEAVRFGCSSKTWRAFGRCLDQVLAGSYGTVLVGSGDFHHVSHLLLTHCRTPDPFDVVVLDNHPDNMRFPFGIHCGSWVSHAASLPQVRSIHVLGISSLDVAWQHAWENRLLPIMRGKLRYWTIGVDTGWARRLGLSRGFASFSDAGTLIDRFIADLPLNAPGGVYLSIDKDVFAPHVASTNWDQGVLELDHARRLIGALSGRLVGSDITGEVSIHDYQTPWKRWLSALDGQPEIPCDRLAAMQTRQRTVNLDLLDWLAQAGC